MMWVSFSFTLYGVLSRRSESTSENKFHIWIQNIIGLKCASAQHVYSVCTVQKVLLTSARCSCGRWIAEGKWRVIVWLEKMLRINKPVSLNHKRGLQLIRWLRQNRLICFVCIRYLSWPKGDDDQSYISLSCQHKTFSVLLDVINAITWTSIIFLIFKASLCKNLYVLRYSFLVQSSYTPLL